MLKRLVVIDLSKDDQKKNLYFCKSKITFQSKKTSVYEEGCLSLPGHFAEIERPAECHIKYIDYDGKSKKIASKWSFSYLHST